MSRFAVVIVCLLGTASCNRSDRGADSSDRVRVDLGTHKLEFLVEGVDQGHPTVILESGLGGRIDGWAEVRAPLREITRVVSYHRAGLGGSQPGPRPRSAMQIVSDLRSALQRLKIRPPYILVGHSIGGLFVRAYAGSYPDEVTALVLADPTMEFRGSLTTSQVYKRLEQNWGSDFEQIQNVLDRTHPNMAEIASRSLLSLEPYLENVTVTEQKPTRLAWLHKFEDRSRQIEGMLALMTDAERQEMFATMESSNTVRDVSTNGIPVVLLVSGKSQMRTDTESAAMDPARSTDYIDWAREARFERFTQFIETTADGDLKVLKNSGHNIPQDRPDAIINAISAFLESTD